MACENTENIAKLEKLIMSLKRKVKKNMGHRGPVQGGGGGRS